MEVNSNLTHLVIVTPCKEYILRGFFSLLFRIFNSYLYKDQTGWSRVQYIGPRWGLDQSRNQIRMQYTIYNI